MRNPIGLPLAVWKTTWGAGDSYSQGKSRTFFRILTCALPEGEGGETNPKQLEKEIHGRHTDQTVQRACAAHSNSSRTEVRVSEIQ